MTPPPKKPSIGIGLIVIGSELATMSLLGVCLDYAFDSSPYLTIVGTLLGFATASFLAWRLLKVDSAARQQSRPSTH